jgi:hypothetical protein
MKQPPFHVFFPKGKDIKKEMLTKTNINYPWIIVYVGKANFYLGEVSKVLEVFLWWIDQSDSLQEKNWTWGLTHNQLIFNQHYGPMIHAQVPFD